MNLLEKYVPVSEVMKKDDSVITIEEFRKYQYSQIKYFIQVCLEYIQKNFKEDFKIKSIRLENELKYQECFGSSYSNLIATITRMVQPEPEIDSEGVQIGPIPEPVPEDYEILNIKIPNLIEGNFFYLNGSIYSPCFYILDKPISLKKKSLKLFGLIHSVTIMKERIIFGGNNIPMNFFLEVIFNEEEDLPLREQFEDLLKITHKDTTTKEVLTFFSGIFSDVTSRKDIIQKLDNLFLDRYTKDLYCKCYGFDPKTISIKTIFHHMVRLLGDESFENCFVDLRQKRIVFLELLLQPIFKKIRDLTIRPNTYQKLNKVFINKDDVIKHFTTVGLKGNYLFDVFNQFGGIVSHYASFLNPGSDNAPSEIRSIHWTHKGIICPITISAQNPGEKVSIISGTLIHKDGFFLDEDQKILN